MLCFLFLCLAASWDVPKPPRGIFEEQLNTVVGYVEDILDYVNNFITFEKDGIQRISFLEELIPELQDYQNDFNNVWNTINNDYIKKISLDDSIYQIISKFDNSSNLRSDLDNIASELNSITEYAVNTTIVELIPEYQTIIDFLHSDILPNMNDIGMFVPALSLNSTWVQNLVSLASNNLTTFNQVASFLGIESTTLVNALHEVSRMLTDNTYHIRNILQYLGMSDTRIGDTLNQIGVYLDSSLIRLDRTIDLIETIFQTVNATIVDSGEYIYDLLKNTFHVPNSPLNLTSVSFVDRFEYIRWGLAALENMPSIDENTRDIISIVHNYTDQFATTGLNITQLIVNLVGNETIAESITNLAYQMVAGEENIFVTVQRLLSLIKLDEYSEYIQQALDALEFFTSQSTTLKEYAEQFGFLDIYNLVVDSLADALNERVPFYNIKVFQNYSLSEDLQNVWNQTQEYTINIMRDTFLLNSIISESSINDNKELFDILSSQKALSDYFQSTYDIVVQYIKQIYQGFAVIHDSLAENPSVRNAFISLLEKVEFKSEWGQEVASFISDVNSSLYEVINETLEPEIQGYFTDWIFTILDQAKSAFEESTNFGVLYERITDIPLFPLINQTLMNAVDLADSYTDFNWTLIFDEIHNSLQEANIDIEHINDIISGICETIINVTQDNLLDLIFGEETANEIREYRKYLVMANDIIDSIENGTIISYLLGMLDLEFSSDVASSYIGNITEITDSYTQIFRDPKLGDFLFGNANRAIFSELIRKINESIFLFPRISSSCYDDINKTITSILDVTDFFAGDFSVQDVIDKIGFNLSVSNILGKFDSVHEHVNTIITDVSEGKDITSTIEEIIKVLEPTFTSSITSVITESPYFQAISKAVDIALFIFDFNFTDPIFGESTSFRDIQNYVQKFYEAYTALYQSYQQKDIQPFDDYLAQYGFSRNQIFTAVRTNISYALGKANDFTIFSYIPEDKFKEVVDYIYLHIVGQLNDFVTNHSVSFTIKDVIDFIEIDVENFNQYKLCITDTLQFFDNKTPLNTAIKNFNFDFFDLPASLTALNRIEIPSITALSNFIVVRDGTQASKRLLEDNTQDQTGTFTIYDLIPLNRLPELLQTSDDIVTEYSLNQAISEISSFNISTIYTNVTSNNFTVETLIPEQAPIINKGLLRALTPIFEKIKDGEPVTSTFIEESFEGYDPLPFPDPEPSESSESESESESESGEENEEEPPQIPDEGSNSTVYIIIGVVIAVVAVVVVIVVIIVIRLKKKKSEENGEGSDSDKGEQEYNI